MPSPSIVLLRTQSDARLVSLAREGHERAFEAIVERYRRQLLRSCRRVLPEARAEDALQQALVAAWRGLERGDEVRELRPWLHRIAHNTSLNLLRQSGYDYDELQESLRIADATEEELERRAVVRQTLHGLAALPERQREALLAIAVEGRSQEEVASDLGLTTGAVRQLVHRARTALRTAATAVLPLPVVSWVAAAGPRGDLAGRIAELSAGAGVGASAALAKAGTVAVLAGGAVVGPALVEKRGGGNENPAHPAAVAAAAAPKAAHDAAATRTPAATPGRTPAVGQTLSTHPSALRREPEHRAPAATTAPRTTIRRGEQVDGDRSDGGGSSGSDRLGGDDESSSGPSSGTDDGLESGGTGGGDGDGASVELGDRSGSSLRSGSSGSGVSGGGDDDHELATPAPSPVPSPDGGGEPEPDSSGPGSGGGGEEPEHD
jgi:RNA polymerase sigma factor (sigma-70 family)